MLGSILGTIIHSAVFEVFDRCLLVVMGLDKSRHVCTIVKLGLFEKHTKFEKILPHGLDFY